MIPIQKLSQIVSQERCRSGIYIKIVVRSLLDVINRIEELVEAPAMLTQAKRSGRRVTNIAGQHILH